MNRGGVAEQFADPSARVSVEADLELIDHFDEQHRCLELQLSRSAKIDDLRNYEGTPRFKEENPPTYPPLKTRFTGRSWPIRVVGKCSETKTIVCIRFGRRSRAIPI